MARLTVADIARNYGDPPPSESFWQKVLEAGAGVLNYREKLAEEGDVLVVEEVRFEFTSVEDETGQGVFVHRFERTDPLEQSQ